MDSALATRRLGWGSQIWNFARHFLEMCVAMCVGGSVLNLLLFQAGPSLIGYADPRLQFPELSLLLIAAVYLLPMVVWMRFRGMAWRPISEMSGAAIGLAVVLIALTLVGGFTQASLREWSLAFCGPACVVMLGAMLFRLDLYTGRTGHHTGHGAVAAHLL
jgi:hypothetical protein